MALIKPNTSKNTISATLSRIAFAPFSLTFYIIRKIAELIYFLAATFVHVAISPFVWAHSFFKKRTPFSTRGLQMSSSVSITKAYGPAADIETGQPDAKQTDPRSSQLKLVEVPVGEKVINSCTPPETKCTANTTKHEKLENRVDTQQMSATVSHANAQPDTKVGQSTRKLPIDSIQRSHAVSDSRYNVLKKSNVMPDPRYIVLRLLSLIPTLTVEAGNEKDKSTPQKFIISCGTSASATQTVQNRNYESTLMPLDRNSEKDKAFSKVITCFCLLLSVMELPVILAQESLLHKRGNIQESVRLLSDYESKLSKAIGKLFRHLLLKTVENTKKVDKKIQADKKEIIDQFNLLTQEETKNGFGIVPSDSTSPILTAQANFLTHLAGVAPSAETLGHLTGALDCLIVMTPGLRENLKALQVSGQSLPHSGAETFHNLVSSNTPRIFRTYFMKACRKSSDSTAGSAKPFSEFLSELSKIAYELTSSEIPLDWDLLLKIFDTRKLDSVAESGSENSSTCGDSGYQKNADDGSDSSERQHRDPTERYSDNSFLSGIFGSNNPTASIKS